jgi:hypothetical protein
VVAKAEGVTAHLRLLAGDPTASYDCVELWLPYLESSLAAAFPAIAARDSQLITSAALDALFDYIANPRRFDVSRSGLASYLQMAARRDLQNALSREKTQGRGATSLEGIEMAVPDDNDLEDAVAEKVDASALWSRVIREFTDPLDRSLLRLMLSGERTTAPFARVLGVSDRPEREQRVAVKRCKDRLSKRLARLGESIHGYE